MRREPIEPTQEEKDKFNILVKSDLLKEQFLLGNIFYNERSEIEMVFTHDFKGIDTSVTEERHRLRNSISTALRKEKKFVYCTFTSSYLIDRFFKL